MIKYKILNRGFEKVEVKAFIGNKVYYLYISHNLLLRDELEGFREAEYYTDFVAKNIDLIIENVQSGCYRSYKNGVEVDFVRPEEVWLFN